MRFLIDNLPTVLSLLAGIALILVEMFLPGFGAPGIAGAMLLTCAVVFTWVNYGALYGCLMMIFVLVLIIAALIISLRSASSGRLSRSRLFLKSDPTDESSGKQSDIPRERTLSVGDQGITETALRPAGIAMIGSERVSVVADGQYIDRQVKIRVTQIEGSRVVVKAAE